MNKHQEIIKEVQDLDSYYKSMDIIHIKLLQQMIKPSNSHLKEQFEKLDKHLRITLNEFEKICIIKRDILGSMRK